MTLTDDRITPFQVADTAVRGRVVRLAGSIDEILSAHVFPPNLSNVVGEAAVFVAAMGATLKFDGKFILQLSGEGPVPMVLADFSADGSLRAMAANPTSEIEGLNALGSLIGDKARMMVTVDQGVDMERYQGVTPVEGATFADAAEFYFQQSEQLPTVARFAVGRLSLPGQAEVWRAGGIIAQYVPSEGGDRERGEEVLRKEADREIWDRAEAFVRSTQMDELIDPELSSHDLLYRLFHEDGVRVFDAKPVRASCPCNAGKIETVLSQYEQSDLADMADANGVIEVSCEFCRATFRFDVNGRELVG
ncbi:MAG: Hsp33 family molecular chaperone HslO [Pseudomonadota bacterium]